LAERTSPTATPSRHRRIKRVLVILGVALGLVAGYLFLKPVGIPVPDGSAVRPMSWSEARAAVADIQAREAADPTIRADCRTRLYDHGERTAKVIVLLHGYTNCPKQDDELAGRLVDLGYTVYVPLMPHHGQVPERRDPLGSLKADEIAAYGDQAMNVANGLGDEVSVLGLSGGGLVASYIAQYRADADLVVPIAAFMGPPSIPAPLTGAALNAIELLPPIDNRDPAPDEAVRGAFPHGASDTSIQGAAAYMQVGQTVLRSALETAPKAGRIVTVINDADTTVSNTLIDDLSGRWHATAPDRTQVRHLDASLGLLHDMITPDREGQKVDIAYPILLELLTGS
jgi:pimeloyl-ACP methyl ester carboxylesterase